MNAALTAAIIKLVKDFPDDIQAVMQYDKIELLMKGDLEKCVDVVALAMNNVAVDVDFAVNVVDVLDENGVDYESWS